MSSLNIAKARLHPRKKLLIQQELQRALHLHQLGKLELAEQIYQTILKKDAYHFDALHLLGLVYAQSNRPKYAEPLFNKAIRLNPNGASLHSNYGIVLNQLGKFNDSLLSFDRAIQQNPKHFDAHLNRGNLLKDMERFDDALNSYGNCINITSDRADVYFNRANLLKQIKRFDEAISDYNKAIFINPNSSEFYSNRGSTFKEMNLLEDALNNYNQALILDKNNYDIYYNRGNLFNDLNLEEKSNLDYNFFVNKTTKNIDLMIKQGRVLYKLKRFEESLQKFCDILSNDEDFVEALFLRGLVYTSLNRPLEALEDYAKAISINGNFSELYCNRGITFQSLNQLSDAILDFKKAILLDPNSAIAYYNCGNAYRDSGNITEAIIHFEKATVLNKNYNVAYLNHAFCSLSLREFSVGWDKYESRANNRKFIENSIIGHADLDVEFSIRNNQCDMVGKTIFVAAEQGIGDYIMFLSILPDLCLDASRVVCQLDHRLMDLFSRCFPDVTFVRSDHLNTIAQMNIDKHIRMGSLGYTYRRELKDFSGIPYLTPNYERTADWQLRLPSNAGKIKIGISWQGGTEKTNGANRSMTLEQLKPLLDREDCTFVSLQYGEVEADVATFNEGRTHKLLCFPKRDINNFEDFAGLIGALDCVISVQNTTVHTCGALGKPCFAMLPFRPEWRYGASGDSMPWYKSVKLFRQTHDGKWSDVIEHISEELDVFKIQREIGDRH